MKKTLMIALFAVVLLVVSCSPSLSFIEVDAPCISIETLDTAYLVTITCSNPNGQFYYSVNGNNPVYGGRKYEKPFEVEFGATIKACTKIKDATSSVTILETVQPTSETPVVFIDKENCLATILCEDLKASVFYKIGSEAFKPYSSPVRLDEGEIISAMTTKKLFKDSDVVQEMHVPINAPKVSTPRISTSASSKYNEGVSFVTFYADEGVDIYYTIDGSEPSKKSTKYTGQFYVEGENTVKAIAIPPTISGKNDSNVFSSILNNGKDAPKGWTWNGFYSVTPPWLKEMIHWQGYSIFSFGWEYEYMVIRGDVVYCATLAGELVTLPTLVGYAEKQRGKPVYRVEGRATKGFEDGQTVYYYTMTVYFSDGGGELELFKIAKYKDRLRLVSQYNITSYN